MKVPFFDYPRHYTAHREEYLRIFDDVCSRGAFIMQTDLEIFETAIANYTNSFGCIGVANATDALELCWQSLNLQAGDEVILSSHTMLATASAVVMAGGTPVPVDIADDGLIDVKCIELAISPRTVGIMPTNLNGRCCDMPAIIDLAKSFGLHVVEDAAQALGSKVDNIHAGTFGYASGVSFYPAKTLGSFGDGGCILANSSSAYDKLFQMRDHGRDKSGKVKCWGRNSRLDNLQAAFLSYNFSDFSTILSRRRAIASLYTDMLCDNPHIILPPSPTSDGRHFDVYQNYEILVSQRDNLQAYLRFNGVGTIVQWGGDPIHSFSNLGFQHNDFPRTNFYFEHCLLLPMNIFISNEDVCYVCDLINKFSFASSSISSFP